MRTLILLFFLWGSFASWGQSKQEKLIDQYLTQGAYRYHYTQAQYYLDKALIEYPKFSDAQYYKGMCFLAQTNKTEAQNIMLAAQENAKQGYTINEDDAYYESYPYQVNWHMAQWTIPQDTP